MPERVSVILPVNRWSALADDAVRSVVDQRDVDAEILLIVNGRDQQAADNAWAWAGRASSVRVMHRASEGLAGALNEGLRAAASDLVARMDADDLSYPDRLRLQAEHMRAHPDHAACGCGAEFVDRTGARATVALPPATPQESAWRLLIGNAFVHGSMMLRRDAVLDAGGYNEKIDRGQDYELWLRIRQRGLSGIPDVLYTYRAPDTEIDERQALLTSGLLLKEWAALPEGDPGQIAPLMSRLLMGDAGARTDLESIMEREGPSRSALQAWMWSCRQHPIARTNTEARATRLRLAGQLLRSTDTGAVWLWGAGDMARYVLSHRATLGVEIAGVADDHRAGSEVGGLWVVRPDDVPREATVLIASDLYEDAIWDKSAPLRDRGVRVLRMPAA